MYLPRREGRASASPPALRTPAPNSEPMKPQKSPFDVELKRPKRTTGKFAPSIWASIDLKAIVAEAGGKPSFTCLNER